MYEYHFPAKGKFESPKETREYTNSLEYSLATGKNNLESLRIFQGYGTPFDHVSLDVDESNGNISGISLHTKQELITGEENRLQKCMEENVIEAGINYYGKLKAVITGPMEDMNRDNEQDWSEKISEGFADSINHMKTLDAVLE